MLTNAAITLWHRGAICPETRMETGFLRLYFPKVSLRQELGIIGHLIGRSEKDELSIRIGTRDDLPIMPGDRVIVGRSGLETPPEHAKVVTSVTDNRHGSRRVGHWKVVCR